jgi:hypothetical protein
MRLVLDPAFHEYLRDNPVLLPLTLMRRFHARPLFARPLFWEPLPTSSIAAGPPRPNPGSPGDRFADNWRASTSTIGYPAQDPPGA